MKTVMRSCAVILATVLLLSSRAHAQWVEVSGLYGGSVHCFAVTDTFLFAGTGDGVSVSTDKGNTWTEVNSGMPHTIVQTLAMDSVNLFAGTYNGVFHSTNKGESWTAANSGLANTDVRALTVSGANLLAGTGAGLFRSTNDGGSWTEVSSLLANRTVRAFALLNSNLFAGTDSGLFASTNNGTSWTEANAGLTGRGIHALTVLNASLFAGTDSGVFVSTNNGTSWAEVSEIDTGLYNPYVTSFAVSGTKLFVCVWGPKLPIVDPEFGFVGGPTSYGVYVSTDLGTTWQPVNSGLTDVYVRSIAICGSQLLAGTATGVYLSSDNGSSWSRIDPVLPGPVWSLAVSGTNLFAGTLGHGVFLSSKNGRSSWTAVDSGLTNPNVRALAVLPESGSGTKIIAGTENGVCVSTNNGTSWIEASTGLTNRFVYALALSGSNLYAGTAGGVSLSTDGGTSWSDVNNGLGANPVILSLAVSGANLFAGTNGDGVFLSTNNGSAWTAVNSGLYHGGYWPVNSLAVSGTNLFAATNGGGIFYSDNHGSNWSLANSGIIEPLPSIYAHALAITGMGVFVGTQNHVYLSTNNGTSWTNVGDHFFMAFSVVGSDIFAGQYYSFPSGVWRRPLLEMVTSVRQHSAEIPGLSDLQQNFPNPFNSSTTISYELPYRSQVKLTVFNLLGQQVTELINEELDAGYYQKEWNAGVASGLYFYRIEATSVSNPSKRFVDTKKMLYLK